MLEEDNRFIFANVSDTPPFEVGILTTFPPRLFRHLPSWFNSIPDNELKALLREVYGALQNDLRRLALMGVRTIVDRIVTKAVGDTGPFSKRLKA